MTLTLLSTLLLGAFGGPTEFQPPVRLKADGLPVRVESPGYAAPCWADIDGDGKKDLLVGQFHGGKIHFYNHHSPQWSSDDREHLHPPLRDRLGW
jgi:hypothetical protein